MPSLSPSSTRAVLPARRDAWYHRRPSLAFWTLLVVSLLTWKVPLQILGFVSSPFVGWLLPHLQHLPPPPPMFPVFPDLRAHLFHNHDPTHITSDHIQTLHREFLDTRSQVWYSYDSSQAPPASFHYEAVPKGLNTMAGVIGQIRALDKQPNAK
ncbi:hypothetical protein DL93DRAFT_784860 [Clavulina sp. PMI_390]|nr:hypothetical protein DL93DRAFT_784860 [Clavulina sp. PMI_390]